MTTRRILMMLALLVPAWALLPAQPRWEDEDERGPGPGRRGALHEELNLTDRQEEQMERLRLDMQKKMDVQRARIREARFELRNAQRAEKPDRAVAEKHLKEITDAEHAMKLARLDHWMAVRGVLTPEQVKVWQDRRPTGRGMMRDGGPGRGGPGQRGPGHRGGGW